KKIQNHEAAVALHYMHYNFARIHQTLRTTPAMAAGISDHVWSFQEIAALAEAELSRLSAAALVRRRVQSKGAVPPVQAESRGRVRVTNAQIARGCWKAAAFGECLSVPPGRQVSQGVHFDDAAESAPILRRKPGG